MSCLVSSRRFVPISALWLVVGCGLCGGCSWPSLRGPAFKDEPKIGRLADPLFPSPKGNSTFGFSTKAQQIERNLGIE